MKILCYVDTFSPHTETFVYNYINELNKHEEVLVVCQDRQNESRFPFSNVSVIARDESFKSKAVRKLYYCDYLGSKHIKRELDVISGSFVPDVILCFFLNQSFTLLKSINHTRIPVFIMALGYDASELLQSSLLYVHSLKRLLVHNNVTTIYVSHALKRNLNNAKVFPASESVIPLCTDTEFYSRDVSIKNDGKKTFIQVSSFVGKKGHVYTLQALKKFKNTNPDKKFSMLFIGDGPLLNKCKELVIQLNIEEEVEFLGWKNKDDIKYHLSYADVFIHNSVTSDKNDTEGMPTAIIEAMSMELPILSTFHSGIPEIVEHGVNGLLSQERNILDYVSNLEIIYSWNKLPENRIKIIQSHSIIKQSKLLLDLMKSN